MNVTIECYGASQRWCGARQISLSLAESSSAGDALEILAQRYPDFASRRESVAVALGNAIVGLSSILNEGDILALIPPVSGG